MATRDQTGDYGWVGGHTVEYSTADKMTTARAIRDHLLATSGPDRPTPVVRDCGGSNATSHVWGVPNVTVGGPSDLDPPSNFAQLVWEVRQRAEMGFEQGRIVPRSLPLLAQIDFLQTALAVTGLLQCAIQ